MGRLSRTEQAILADYRALCPCVRRRQHLLLLYRESGKQPIIRAIVRVDDAQALRPLVVRLRENVPAGELRVAEAEDGVQDDVAAWVRGVDLDRFLVEARCGHA